MSNSNQTTRSSKWPSLSLSKEDSEEDFAEDSRDEEEALVEEEDEVESQSIVIAMEYLGTIRGIFHMHSVHTVWPVSIMLKISLS